MTDILCVRHGEAGHNVLYKQIGDDAYIDESVLDAPLTDYGIIQAKVLNKQILNIPNIDVVLVSPLTRTLETNFSSYTEENSFI